MKTIKLTPAKLDAAADEYFDSVRYHESNPHLPVTTTYLERSTLAGLALRRWAVSMRRARKRAKRG
jgi:hypothetical protein